MALDWSGFAALPGSEDYNFEQLIRALVLKKWARYGELRWRRAQPGVEFHLKLHTDCDLGQAGQRFGWQCKFYELPQSHALNQTRRDAIEDAIAKATKDLPDLTDSVLCLPERPAKESLEWYFGLQSEEEDALCLHLWTDEDIDAYLNGEAELLRATYFGNLVFTADRLATAHARAVQPVRHRWVPDLNVVTSVEQQLRTALLQPGCTDELRQQAQLLGDLAEGRGTSHHHGWRLRAIPARDGRTPASTARSPHPAARSDRAQVGRAGACTLGPR